MDIGGYNQTFGGDGGITSTLLNEEDIIDIRTKKINFWSPQDVYKMYQNKISFATFDKVWNGKYYLDIMGDIYNDKKFLKFIEKVLKQRMNIEKNNTDINVILDIRQRKLNGEKRKDVLNIYNNMSPNTFDGIWYNKYYKEIQPNNLEYIKILRRPII